MEVKLAERMGFCFGVKRAVDTVYEQIKNGKNIYTYGPIVNNEEVVRELAEQGVKVLESERSLRGFPRAASSSAPTASPRKFTRRCGRRIWNASMPPAPL